MRIFIAAICLVLSFSVQAADDNKQAKLKELVSVMDMDAMVETMYSQMESMMAGMSQQMGITPEEQPIFDKYYARLTDILKAELSWAVMEPDIIAIYDEAFSSKEIDGMLAFYRSETGQAILQKMPSVMQQSMMISQKHAQQIFPKMQQVAAELQAELRESRQAK